MMKNKKNIEDEKCRAAIRARAGLLALAGGLFLLALLCGGCGRGETITIGTPPESGTAGGAADTGGAVPGVTQDGGAVGSAQGGADASGADVSVPGSAQGGAGASGGGVLGSVQGSAGASGGGVPGSVQGGAGASGGGVPGSVQGGVLIGGTQTDENIRVYVCGAVMCPGVVAIPKGSRAEDALQAAGGFSGEAGREAVNLADWVADGQMLYFPTQEEAADWKNQETPAWTGQTAGSGQSPEAAVPAGSGLVNLNTADAASLCTLPGIGESRAADIIAYREKNGGFETCEDVMNVSGIKTSVYEKICDKITVK